MTERDDPVAPTPPRASMPLVVVTPEAIRRWTIERRRAGHTIGFVPTMGALHAGHLALIREAVSRADHVAVSIFVNPLQFDQGADLADYPRTFDDDLMMCADAGVEVVYAPPTSVMYPDGFQTRVEPGGLTTRLEGASREGHFTGVATVVTKLLAAVGPDLAVFGDKDAQQLAVVRRVVADLDLGVEIIGHRTVRDDDGLALSSRNRRLDPQERIAARCLPEALDAVRSALAAGQRSVERLIEVAVDRIEAEPLARIDYLQLVDSDEFNALYGDLDESSSALAVAAIWIGETRLIDNLALET